MKARIITLILILLPILTLAAGDILAETLTVTKTEDTADGICNADCSLREAVATAVAGDVVVFSELFKTKQQITLTLGHMEVTRSITINGPGRTLLTLSANNKGRHFKIVGGPTVRLSGMLLRDGHVGQNGVGDENGGSIWVIGSILEISAMELSYNTAFEPEFQRAQGGAVFAYETGTVTADDVYVHDNAANGSGGISASVMSIRNSIVTNNVHSGIDGDNITASNLILSGNTGKGVSATVLSIADSVITGNGAGVRARTSLAMERCVVSNNGTVLTDGIGGGVSSSSGSNVAAIRSSVISNNFSNGFGGGVSNIGTLHLINSSITGNQAVLEGGGISSYFGELTVTNSTISGNASGVTGFWPGPGGGIYYEASSNNPNDSRIRLTNVTVTNNTTSDGGGGIRHDTNNAAIRNTIIAGNSANTSHKDVSGTFISEGVNLIGNTTGSTGWIAPDLLNQSPLLAPLANNGGTTLTHALLPGSPAIDAGRDLLALDPQTNLPLITDQRGILRILSSGENPAVDIGSYEALYSTGPTTVSGRFLGPNGKSLRSAVLTLSDQSSGGILANTLTNPFGYYRFHNLSSSQGYILRAVHKSYTLDSSFVFSIAQGRKDRTLITY